MAGLQGGNLLVPLVLLAALALLVWKFVHGPVKPDERERALARAQNWWRDHYVTVIVIGAGFLFLGAFLAYIAHLPGLIGDILDLLGDEVDRDAASAETIRALGYTAAALMGALIVAAAVPFQLIKTWVNERTARTAEEGLVTTRLAKAIELLGTEKTTKFRGRTISYKVPEGEHSIEALPFVQRFGQPEEIPEDAEEIDRGDWQTIEETTPNLEVRLGAIYALERIAEDSERDHIPIMETLCAYIRENAKAETAKPHGLGDFPPFPEGGDAAAVEAWETAHKAHGDALRAWAENLPPPRVDIQAALNVIGRRSARRREHEEAKGYRLDLRETNLRGADLGGSRLAHVRLDGAHLEGGLLTRADLRSAELDRIHLERAWLFGANLEGAQLREAHLEGACLAHAQLLDAALTWAHLETADLDHTRLENALLCEARLERATLNHARLQGASLGGVISFEESRRGPIFVTASVNGAHLEGASLKQAHLDDAWLDGAVLTSTDLANWTVNRASLLAVDLGGARNLAHASLRSAFGVRSGSGRTILPEDYPLTEVPAHWHAADADTDGLATLGAYRTAYRAWLNSGAPVSPR